MFDHILLKRMCLASNNYSCSLIRVQYISKKNFYCIVLQFFLFFFTFYSFLYTYTAAKWDTTLPAILIWQQFNKKPHYIYQIWWKDLLTPQSLEIRFTFGSQPHTRDDVSCHWFIYKKTLWFNGLPFQSSIMTHLIWILCSCTFKMLT